MVEYYNGEEVTEFESKCPVEGCTNQNICHWRHRGCNKKEYINTNAEIICTDCGHKNGFYNWKFNCGDHQNYKPPINDPQRLIGAFSVIGKLKNAVGKAFLKKLLNSLIDQA